MEKVHVDGKDCGEITSLTTKRMASTLGEVMSNVNILSCISSLGFDLKYNEILSEIECNSEPMSDAVQAEILSKLRIVGEEEKVELLKSAFWTKGAIKSVPIHNSYNPLVDYIDMAHLKYQKAALQHDGKFSPIRELCDCIKVQYDGAEMEDWAFECIRYWLCGAIAKVKYGFQNWMLVLQGPQGVGKSLLARKLGRAAGNQYFTAGSIDPRNKDHILKRASTFVWEAEELDGTMNYADMAHLKAFLTQDSAKERGAYKEYAKTYKSVCSFIGTVNHNEFLKDMTGNRRYLCLEVLDMCREKILMMNEDLIWGEASYLLENELPDVRGGHIQLSPKIHKLQTITNENVLVESGMEVALKARIRPAKGNISSEQLRALISALGFQHGLFPVAKQILTKMGFEYKSCLRTSSGGRTSGFSGCEITHL